MTHPELPIFRLVAREFADMADDYICQWIELTRPWISNKQFRALTPQAVATLTAYRLKAAADALAEADGEVTLASLTGENASESYAVNAVNLALDDAALRENSYGRQFLAMRQAVIM